MKKLSLNAKIYLVLSIFIAASVVISVMGLRKLGEINTALENLIKGSVERSLIALQMKGMLSNQIVFEKNIIISAPEKRGTFIKAQTETHEKVLRKHEDALLISDADSRKQWDEYLQHYSTWWKLTSEIRGLLEAGKTGEAADLSLNKTREIRLKVEAVSDAIVKENAEAMEAERLKASADYQAAKLLITFTSLIAILSGLVLATLILRNLNRAISQVIDNLDKNSTQVSSAAQQIASSSEELSQSATEQASSLEETAASIEEMSSMVQKNAENAKRTSDLSIQSSQSAEKGIRVMTSMVRAIDDIQSSNSSIKGQVTESNQQISEIVKVIAEIGNKTKVINDIVFQTKLLSFNASVEAARAGEHGKGFAVVAEEVGNLAQMSGNAAKEISDMLTSSIHKVESIVRDTKEKVEKLITEGQTKVQAGTEIARECGEVLKEISTNVASVTQMSNEIATACLEQAQGVQEITKAMNQLDQVTQTNAATSEEAASAAEELSSQSEALQATVGLLIQTIRGDKGDVVHAPAQHAPKPRALEVKKEVPQIRLDNVVHIPKKPTPLPAKKVVGLDTSIPSENDPRFEDI